MSNKSVGLYHMEQARTKPESLFNPFAHENFAKKYILKLVKRLSGHCRAIYKELKLTIKPFTDSTLHSLLIHMQNISLQCSGMDRKQSSEIVF